VLADVRLAAEALRIATDQRPDHVLVDAAIGGMGLVPLVRQMRRASPESQVVTVGTKGMLRRDMLLQLIEQGIRGYLLWEGLGADMVVRCLAVVREDGPLVWHRTVLEELLAIPERRQRSHNADPDLTDDERAVLSLLIGDLTQPEIAAALPMSEATVKRTVAALRATFGVRTTNALCWHAGRLGLVPCGDSDIVARGGAPDRKRSDR